jgi:hypothetical protein
MRGGESDEWLSPPDIVRRLGPFNLDPCTPVVIPDGFRFADECWNIHDCGLLTEWPRESRVWLNPPYSSIGRWLGKAARHRNSIAIMFARTETRVWFESVWPAASGLLFLKGRPTFYRPDGTPGKGNAGGPIVLVAYGASNADALAYSGLPGAFVSRIQVQPERKTDGH